MKHVISPVNALKITLCAKGRTLVIKMQFLRNREKNHKQKSLAGLAFGIEERMNRFLRLY